MESSTSLPTASASPPNVMMFSEAPPNLNQMNVMSIERGIATRMMSVPRMFRRKSMMMIMARSAPIPPSRSSPEIVCRM